MKDYFFTARHETILYLQGGKIVANPHPEHKDALLLDGFTWSKINGLQFKKFAVSSEKLERFKGEYKEGYVNKDVYIGQVFDYIFKYI